MKKYRFLGKGERLEKGDEVNTYKGRWLMLPDMYAGSEVDSNDERFEAFRRPDTFSGKTAFLVAYAPIIRVVVDTTGLSEEELDMAVAYAARDKFEAEAAKRMGGFTENIDWEKTEEDTETPYDPHTDLFPDGYIPDGCNPDNEFGKRWLWNAFQVGNDGNIVLRVQRIDEPTDSDPLASDEVACELARLAGMEVDENGYVK